MEPRIENCSRGTEGAVTRACSCLGSLTPSFLSYYGAIARANGCPPLSMAQLRCLRGWCGERCRSVICHDVSSVCCLGSPDCWRCLAGGGGLCAYVFRSEAGQACSRVHLCSPRHQRCDCEGLGPGAHSPTACTMYHEIGHLCGLTAGVNSEKCLAVLSMMVADWCNATLGVGAG